MHPTTASSSTLRDLLSHPIVQANRAPVHLKPAETPCARQYQHLQQRTHRYTRPLAAENHAVMRRPNAAVAHPPNPNELPGTHQIAHPILTLTKRPLLSHPTLHESRQESQKARTASRAPRVSALFHRRPVALRDSPRCPPYLGCLYQ